MTAAATMEAPAAPPSSIAIVQVGTKITGYEKIEAGLAELRTKYADAVFDCRDAKGLAAARAARGELRDTRLRLDETRKEEKAEALKYGRLVDSEAARIEAEIRKLEDPIAAQVQAEDRRREEERQAREKAEAARKEQIQKCIDWLRLCVTQGVGKTAAQLTEFIETIEKAPMAEDLYGERLEEAKRIHGEALDQLTTMRNAAIEQEATAARLRAQEQELAAQRAEQKRQDDERAERQRQEDEARAARLREEDEARAYAIAWDDAHREDVQRTEDAARKFLLAWDEAHAEDARRAEDAQRAFAQAWDDAHAEEARRVAQAQELAAAAKRRQERAELEPKADAWACVESIAVLVSEATDADGEPLPDADCIGIVRETCSLIGSTALARDALASLDRDEAAVVDATEGRR